MKSSSTSDALVHIILISIVCYVRCTIATPPVLNHEEIAQNIDAFVKTAMGCHAPPAFTLAVVKDGHVIMAKGYGHTTSDKSKETTSKTQFAIGSLTKAFTSLLISKVITEANISMDTPITNYIPNFRLSDDYRSKYVTLRDLLGHRTAIPGYVAPLIMGFHPELSRKELVRKVMTTITTPHSFREKWIYNNFMYIIAGDILERLSNGRRWEDLVRDSIFNPLHMTDSGFVDEITDFSNFALPCDERNGTFYDLSTELFDIGALAGPAGTIYSTADDMAKWMTFLLSDDINHNPNGFHPDMVKMTFEPSMTFQSGIDLNKPSHLVSHEANNYCLGWILALYREYRQIYHTGGIVTHSSRLWLFPDVKGGIFMSVNGPEEDKGDFLKAVTYYASDLLIGLPTWFNVSDVCSTRMPWSKPPSEKPTQPPTVVDPVNEADNNSTSDDLTTDYNLTIYIGNYSHPFFGDVSIFHNDSSSTNGPLSFHYGRFGLMDLYPISPSKFKGRFYGPMSFYNYHGDEIALVEFFFDESNNVNSLSFDFDGSDPAGPFYRQIIGTQEANGQIRICPRSTMFLISILYFVLLR